MSLRHLFSTAYAQEILKLSYAGPVLNTAGSIESSPDCMIMDMRSHPFKLLRCEFKYIPQGKEDFVHNGKFDITILWSSPPGRSRSQLTQELLTQNGCAEIIVLEEMKAFCDLPKYTIDALLRIGNTDIIKRVALTKEAPSVFALCIAAQLYPNNFRMASMLELLSTRFPSVRRMHAKGKASVVSAFVQTKPPFLIRMYSDSYRWTSEFDSTSASAELRQLLTTNFRATLPTSDDLDQVKTD